MPYQSGPNATLKIRIKTRIITSLCYIVVLLNSPSLLETLILTPTKFAWQKKLEDEETGFYDFNPGLTNTMSITGSGKTIAQYNLMKKALFNNIKKFRLFVPNENCKTLDEQIYLKFIENLNAEKDTVGFTCKIVKKNPKKNKTKQSYVIKINRFGNSNFPEPFICEISKFISNQQSPNIIVEKINKEDVVVCFDEFDAIQTIFGLNHAAGIQTYSKSTIQNVKEDSSIYNSLTQLCKNTPVYTFSATLDEFMNYDIIPYQNQFKIRNFIIKPDFSELQRDPVKIVYKNKEQLKKQIISNYKSDTKTLVYCNDIKHLNIIENYLKKESVEFYSWHSKKDSKFDREKMESNVISIFVNGMTRGIDIPKIESVILLRPLKASTRIDKSLLSALANQIMGRIRGGGIIYRDEDDTQVCVDNLYDLVIKLYEPFEKSKTIYRKKFFGEITKRKVYESPYINNNIRLFVFSFVTKYEYNIPERGDSITSQLVSKLNPDECNEIKFLKNNIKLESFDEEFIRRYLEYEKTIIKEYIPIFNEFKGRKPDNNGPIFKSINNTYSNNTDSSNNRSGGGAGVLRPNINVDQIQKSIRYLKESIKKCGLHGASTLFNYEECENEFQEELGMMHLKAKTTLTNKQNRQGKYAVPIMDSEEDAINHKDTDTELFIWNNSSGATINYNKLKELVNAKKHKWLRPELDINNILKNYHKKWY